MVYWLLISTQLKRDPLAGRIDTSYNVLVRFCVDKTSTIPQFSHYSKVHCVRLASRRILLVGAGHTNLHIVRMWMQRPIEDASLALISPFACATYSGMLPGTLAGLYAPADMEIDLYRLTKSAGVELIVDEAVSLDADRKELRFQDRPAMSYDVASIGVGSIPRQMDRLGTHPGFVPIKPMFTALHRLDEAIERIKNRPIRIAIIGGGAAGFEVTLCVEHRVRKSGGSAKVTLVDANSEILGGFRNRTIRLAERELRERKIDVRCGGRVTGHNGLDLTFDNGNTLTADVVIWVTGACPPEFLQHVNLPKSEAGFLTVHPTLQSVRDESVFVVGDSAEIEGEVIDRAGVYAVRQGPILWQNLNRHLHAGTLIRYRPQRDFLRLLATGDGRAIAQWKWVSGIGSHWWRLKDRIDSKFMNMHRPSGAMTSRAMMDTPRAANQPQATTVDAKKMRCRGCGGKTSARVLHRVLQRLRAEWPTASKSFLQSDDTALLPVNESLNGVGTHAVSVDFFPSFLDDPWLTGRIAAIHALSDLWASGVQPTAAVAMVTLPEGTLDRQSELLHQVLNGAVRELIAANTVLVGGHTTNGDELAVGFTVFGNSSGIEPAPHRVAGRLPFSKSSLRPGQQLILTKAIGTGIILAANEQSLAGSRSVAAAIDMMLQSSQRASMIASKADVSAATDVTGFGLAGHLLEMCQQSSVSVDLHVDALRLIEGTADLIQKGIQSSLYDENKAAVQDFLGIAEYPPQRDLPLLKLEAIYDPQTSGGLLLGVDSDKADNVVSKLIAAGYVNAAIIGCVTERCTTVTINPKFGIHSA